MNIDKALLDEAESLYDPRLAYHKFDHIRMVFGEADRILQRCKKHNIEVDENVVYLALLFHDAGFIENHALKGFESKEAYSADLAGQILPKHNYPDETVRQVQQAIMCTHCDHRCQSNEDKVVKAADLAGLAADFDFFLKNTVRLRAEYEMFNQSEIEWEHWKQLAIDRLRIFIEDEMELTDEEFDENGNSLFKLAVAENIQRLQEEPEPDRT